ncbi:hypothetical protein FGO68_gene5076 [Halteria grandinella]|uniref:Uncharacterized protein n=1 Tax=Halteria grandinella TaxID=5974 RepID=A0A8J8NGE0_HALGN|nr:hypothetical protein FGO68_gene5076 [Halteria grandinella]
MFKLQKLQLAQYSEIKFFVSTINQSLIKRCLNLLIDQLLIKFKNLLLFLSNLVYFSFNQLINQQLLKN